MKKETEEAIREEFLSIWKPGSVGHEFASPQNVVAEMFRRRGLIEDVIDSDVVAVRAMLQAQHSAVTPSDSGSGEVSTSTVATTI